MIGSSSKMLSKDIVTNFRDRGSEIKVYPLSFAEYLPVAGMEKADALEEYMMYGGMPLAVLEPDEKEKNNYLQGLFTNVYIKDIVERYKLRNDNMLSALVDVLSSSVGSPDESEQYEIDFMVNVSNDKVYIQSALNVDTPEKKAQETFSLRNTGDFFRKIVVLDGNSKL